MIRVVQDLTRNELDELKRSYVDVMFEQVDECGDDEKLRATWEDYATAPETIPDELIFEYYAGVGFVDDDFFCNIAGYR